MNLLITQCVQNDFVRPLAEGERLPNLVHVGRLEAERLCGPQGALVDFLTAAHAVEPGRLAIVHVVDRHDPVRHAAHLAQFRPHCLAGSAGARLVDPIEELAARRPNTRLVPAGDLNDFEEAGLREALEALLSGADRERLRIGVVGVWTDAKVSYLLYDLKTRLGASQLATCSALTGSRSLSSHFAALQSLGSLLEVQVLHSPGAFLDWLVPGHGVPAPANGRGRLRLSRPAPVPAWWTPEHVAERDALLGHFAAGDTPLELTPLGGGFSGAQVFVARSQGGRAAVLKLGARDEVARERFGNESIGRVLGDVVPKLIGWREGRLLAAMELELARSDEPGLSAPTTFQGAAGADSSESGDALLAATLEHVLDRALGRLYRSAEKDNADLLEAYGFTDRHGRAPFAELVLTQADQVARGNGFATAAELLHDSALEGPWSEPAAFYRDWLPGRTLIREVYCGSVHGDLNLANLLLSHRAGEAHPARAWVIDFARLARLPCLTDFAKLENDLAYILLPVAGPEELGRARRLEQARLASETLALDLLPLATTAPERRHARLVGVLRAIAARIDPRGAAAMQDYRVALLRYAAHTLGFDEPSPWQRRLALEACARLAAGVAGAG